MSNKIILAGISMFVLFAYPSYSPAHTEDEKNTIRIYDRAKAAVVNITSRSVSYDFFMTPIPQEGSGSGTIIDQKGHIVTNYHVVRGAQRLEVTLSDGSQWEAQLVGADPLSDLATLHIDAPPEQLSVISMGDSLTLRTGQKVLAIGNPFGLGQTLTTGVISSIRKTLQAGGVELENVIQTDAAINPGNSGGPLLDSSGKMIGINTAIFTPSGGSVGIGFAIPIHTAKRVIAELIRKGYVSYPWMGVEMQTILPRFAQTLKLPVQHGVLLVRVLTNGPAAKAGLRGGTRQVRIGNSIVIVGGDVITALAGNAVASVEELSREMRHHTPGATVSVTIIRDNTQRDVSITLGERPLS
ncbi:MAG TPA: PDZ domain-containing protein [Nitrospirales bacterium]|nr:PDZ domain-containing protein [Nitrospirales bacterium]